MVLKGFTRIKDEKPESQNAINPIWTGLFANLKDWFFKSNDDETWLRICYG